MTSNFKAIINKTEAQSGGWNISSSAQDVFLGEARSSSDGFRNKSMCVHQSA